MAELSARLFAALDRDRGAYRRDPELLVPIVSQLLAPHFDTAYAARIVLGSHWRQATAEQRQRFAAALFHSLLRTYAGAVAEWTADQVKLLPLRDDPAALQVIVHTLVTHPDAAVAPVDYRLHQTADGWQIFDVIVEGVSYVRNYHNDIDGEVTQQGLDAAIARLERATATRPAGGRSTTPAVR